MTINKAEPISLEEEELLWESELLGTQIQWLYHINYLYLYLSYLVLCLLLVNFILLKKLVTSVQVTNKYSNLQQTNQISVFAVTIN